MQLNEHEEDQLAKYVQVLRPFYMATMETCADTLVTGSKVIPIIALMKRSLEDEFPDGCEFRDAALQAIEKRFGGEFKQISCRESNAYEFIFFSDEENNRLLAMATLLDPRYKRDFFKSTVTVLSAEKAIKEELLLLHKPAATEVRTATAATKGLFAKRHMFSGPAGLGQQVQLAPMVSVEYDTYVSECALGEEVNPLHYWRDEQRFPNLRVLATKYLTIMGTSVPSERLFSKAGNILTLKRNQLTAESLS